MPICLFVLTTKYIIKLNFDNSCLFLKISNFYFKS